MKPEATAIATSALENSEILHGRLVMQEKQQQQKELYRSAWKATNLYIVHMHLVVYQ